MDFRDDLYFLTLTIAMEAGGEPYNGKLAVAWTVINRGGSVIDTVMRTLQFSAWNADSPTRSNIDTIPDQVLKESYKAACGAYFRMVEDPSKGATHYLNEEATRNIRGGDLPRWFEEERVTIRIGHHTFLKLA